MHSRYPLRCVTATSSQPTESTATARPPKTYALAQPPAPHLGCTAHNLQGDVAGRICRARHHPSGAANCGTRCAAGNLQALRCRLHGPAQRSSTTERGVDRRRSPASGCNIDGQQRLRTALVQPNRAWHICSTTRQHSPASPPQLPAAPPVRRLRQRPAVLCPPSLLSLPPLPRELEPPLHVGSGAPPKHWAHAALPATQGYLLKCAARQPNHPTLSSTCTGRHPGTHRPVGARRRPQQRQIQRQAQRRPRPKQRLPLAAHRCRPAAPLRAQPRWPVLRC